MMMAADGNEGTLKGSDRNPTPNDPTPNGSGIEYVRSHPHASLAESANGMSAGQAQALPDPDRLAAASSRSSASISWQSTSSTGFVAQSTMNC